jgi:hypothetical protein
MSLRLFLPPQLIILHCCQFDAFWICCIAVNNNIVLSPVILFCCTAVNQDAVLYSLHRCDNNIVLSPVILFCCTTVKQDAACIMYSSNYCKVTGL